MSTKGYAWKFLQFLQQYHERKAFLQQIITGDGTWMHHYEPANKCQSYGVETRHCPGPINSSMPSAGKVMLTLFWDFVGPILEHYPDHGQAIDSARYCAMLEEE
jgi:hypothetical protein